MNLENLKEVYDLIAKYEKLKWRVKREVTLLGKKVTLIYSIENFLRAYSNDPVICLEEIKYAKEDKKFFVEIEDAFGDIGNISLIEQEADDLYDELEEELQCLQKLCKETTFTRATLLYKFYTISKLNSWSSVSKECEVVAKQLPITIRLSSSYSAVVKKGLPIEVGCQRISIQTIREIVEAYDKLNK